MQLPSAQRRKGQRKAVVSISGELKIKDAFWIRVVEVDEHTESAVVEVSVSDEKPVRVALNVDPADIFYGSVKVKA